MKLKATEIVTNQDEYTEKNTENEAIGTEHETQTTLDIRPIGSTNDTQNTTESQVEKINRTSLFLIKILQQSTQRRFTEAPKRRKKHLENVADKLLNVT